MPSGRPRNQAGLSKMEGVRRTLASLGNEAMPKAIQTHLEKAFGILMEPNMISNYKSMLRSEGNKSGLIRRPAAPKEPEGFSLADIQAVKEVADRIGADKVRQLASVLGK
jgi:hypothetical protein